MQLTRDGGKTWKNLIGNVSGVPRNTLVSGIEASHHQPGTAYVTFDGHQTGDMRPYVYKTTDFGATWASLATESIKGYAHVVREDLIKPDLLFVGTESGLFLSIDAGKQWAQFTGNFPPVAVRDLAIHSRDSDLIVATHGRGVYIVDDITPIRQISPDVLESKLTVLEPQPTKIRMSGAEQKFGGNDEFVGSNSPEAAFITYYLKERHTFGDFKIQIFDSENHLVTTLSAGTRRGINRVAWPMRMKPPKVPSGTGVEFGSLQGPRVPEGLYTARLLKGDETFTATIRLVGDPASPHSEADRKLQQQTLMKYYRMQERLAYINAAVVEMRDQARGRSKKLKDGDPLRKSLDSLDGKLTDLEKTLVPTGAEGAMPQITGEVRLREEIGEVYGEVIRYGGKPTQSQIDRAVVLEQKVEAAGQSFTELSANVDSMNDALKAQKLDPIKKLSKEEYDKRP